MKKLEERTHTVCKQVRRSAIEKPDKIMTAVVGAFG
jgi:hypothetical protein